MRRCMQHRFHFTSAKSFFASVRLRLTLWYLAIMLFVLISFGGILYGAESFLADKAVDAQLETPLYQDAGQLADMYTQAIRHGQRLSSQHIALSQGEIVLLLTPSGAILDTRGPLTSSAVRQLQARAESGQPTVDMTLPLVGTDPGQGTLGNYRIAITPILNQNTRMAILMVGLSRENQVHLALFWLLSTISVMLFSLLSGYWLAGKALRPVKRITQMANAINATDLRRRLDLKRRDEFGELAATFDQMLARLEAAFKRQKQFTADASHELRTPLTIIDLDIHRALTQLPPSEEYRQVLEQIQAENAQMTSIVNTLLILARADTGQLVLQREEVDLSDIALDSVERLLSFAQQNQVTLSTGALPELLVSGDPQYLSRMFLNLLENAIKYSSGIGTRVGVELACEQERWAVMRVQDDGPGIAEEHLPSLFERFYRVNKTRTRRHKDPVGVVSSREEPGGTGLGLAIVLGIVQAHGGEIRVESKLGSGSLFEVRLPLLSRAEE
jgi:signal transduction histidine kinase